ncbi:unnamed protein product, partial [Polarella glacialis]
PKKKVVKRKPVQAEFDERDAAFDDALMRDLEGKLNFDKDPAKRRRAEKSLFADLGFEAGGTGEEEPPSGSEEEGEDKDDGEGDDILAILEGIFVGKRVSAAKSEEPLAPVRKKRGRSLATLAANAKDRNAKGKVRSS